MYAPTYVVLPFISAAMFFTAAFPAWLTVARISIAGATGLAVVWVVLLASMHYDGRFMLLPLVAAALTLVFGGAAATALAAELSWPQPLVQLALVEAIMFMLAALNLACVWRERARRRGSQPR